MKQFAILVLALVASAVLIGGSVLFAAPTVLIAGYGM